MRGSDFFSKLLVIIVAFFITYLVNFYFIFTKQEMPWGGYSFLIITIIGFVIASVFVFVARRR